MKSLWLCGLMLMTAIPAFADVVVGGTKDPVAPYGYAELKVKDFTTVKWKVTPTPIQYKKCDDGFVRFGGIPGTTYTVEVMVVDFDKKIFDSGEYKVVFSGTSPKPVDPVIDPIDPPKPVDPVIDPTDTLPATLQAAYNSDPDPNKALNTQQLAALFKQSSEIAKTTPAKTVLALFQQVGGARDLILPGNPIAVVRASIEAELNKTLPTKTNAVLDDAARKLCSAQFLRIANALGRIKQ